MKTRKVLIATLIIAILAVYYLIGSGYLNERNEKETLTTQIAEANAALALIPLPPADLDEQLANAQDKLWALNDALNIDTNITRIVNGILRLAEETGVKAIPLSTQPWITERVLQQDYSVFRIDMEVTGNFTEMADFLYRLENGEPKTLILEYFNIEKVSGSFLLEQPDEGPINADIRIAVYAPPITD